MTESFEGTAHGCVPGFDARSVSSLLGKKVLTDRSVATEDHFSWCRGHSRSEGYPYFAINVVYEFGDSKKCAMFNETNELFQKIETTCEKASAAATRICGTNTQWPADKRVQFQHSWPVFTTCANQQTAATCKGAAKCTWRKKPGFLFSGRRDKNMHCVPKLVPELSEFCDCEFGSSRRLANAHWCMQDCQQNEDCLGVTTSPCKQYYAADMDSFDCSLLQCDTSSSCFRAATYSRSVDVGTCSMSGASRPSACSSDLYYKHSSECERACDQCPHCMGFLQFVDERKCIMVDKVQDEPDQDAPSCRLFTKRSGAMTKLAQMTKESCCADQTPGDIMLLTDPSWNDACDTVWPLTLATILATNHEKNHRQHAERDLSVRSALCDNFVFCNTYRDPETLTFKQIVNEIAPQPSACKSPTCPDVFRKVIEDIMLVALDIILISVSTSKDQIHKIARSLVGTIPPVVVFRLRSMIIEFAERSSADIQTASYNNFEFLADSPASYFKEQKTSFFGVAYQIVQAAGGFASVAKEIAGVLFGNTWKQRAMTVVQLIGRFFFTAEIAMVNTVIGYYSTVTDLNNLRQHLVQVLKDEYQKGLQQLGNGIANYARDQVFGKDQGSGPPYWGSGIKDNCKGDDDFHGRRLVPDDFSDFGSVGSGSVVGSCASSVSSGDSSGGNVCTTSAVEMCLKCSFSGRSYISNCVSETQKIAAKLYNDGYRFFYLLGSPDSGKSQFQAKIHELSPQPPYYIDLQSSSTGEFDAQTYQNYVTADKSIVLEHADTDTFTRLINSNFGSFKEGKRSKHVAIRFSVSSTCFDDDLDDDLDDWSSCSQGDARELLVCTESTAAPGVDALSSLIGLAIGGDTCPNHGYIDEDKRTTRRTTSFTSARSISTSISAAVALKCALNACLISLFVTFVLSQV